MGGLSLYVKSTKTSWFFSQVTSSQVIESSLPLLIELSHSLSAGGGLVHHYCAQGSPICSLMSGLLGNNPLVVNFYLSFIWPQDRADIVL